MTVTRPSQQQLQKYLNDRRKEGGPPPSPERIRELLGWAMIQAERGQK